MEEINIGNPEQLSNSERMLYNIANNSSIKTDPPNSRVEKLLEQIMENSGSAALRFIGVTTTEIEDESTTSPVVINGEEVTPDNGDIVFYIKCEYVWDGSKWRLLGDSITYAYYTEDTTAQKASFSGQKHFEINGDPQYSNTFSNNYNIAFGQSNTVSGKSAFAMGASNTVSGEYAMAQGINSYSTGAQSHAEGDAVNATNAQAHAEGQQTTASGAQSHAEGYITQASGLQSHAEGNATQARGSYAHAEGLNSTAQGEASHAEGSTTNAFGKYSHAEGYSTTAPGQGSHAEGNSCYSIGNYSHAEGDSCYSPGGNSHAEGSGRYAVGNAAHAEGVGNSSVEVKGEAAHAEGYYTKTDGTGAHAEGYRTTAFGGYSHAEGNQTAANAEEGAHAEGYSTTASGNYSHAEGYKTIVSGYYSHAEGYQTTVSARYSHAEGWNNIINSQAGTSHVEGYGNVVNGSCSHVGGWNNIAGSNYQTVIGEYNEPDTHNVYSFIIGNGTGDNYRSNGFTVKWDGTAQVGRSPVNDMDIATKKYVDDNSSTVHQSTSAPTASDGKNGDIWYKMTQQVDVAYTVLDSISTNSDWSNTETTNYTSSSNNMAFTKPKSDNPSDTDSDFYYPELDGWSSSDSIAIDITLPSTRDTQGLSDGSAIIGISPGATGMGIGLGWMRWIEANFVYPGEVIEYESNSDITGRHTIEYNNYSLILDGAVVASVTPGEPATYTRENFDQWDMFTHIGSTVFTIHSLTVTKGSTVYHFIPVRAEKAAAINQTTGEITHNNQVLGLYCRETGNFYGRGFNEGINNNESWDSGVHTYIPEYSQDVSGIVDNVYASAEDHSTDPISTTWYPLYTSYGLTAGSPTGEVIGTTGEVEGIDTVYTKYDGAWYEIEDNNTTYTAGENITIDSNNVISATISGGTGTPFVMVNNSTTSQHWEASLPNVTSISTGFTVLVANMGSGVYTSETVDFNLTYNGSDSTGAVPVYISKGTGVSEKLLAGNTTAPEVFMLMFFKANKYSINGTIQAASKWVVVGIS